MIPIEILRGETIHSVEVKRLGVSNGWGECIEFLTFDMDFEVSLEEEVTILRHIRYNNPKELVLAPVTARMILRDTKRVPKRSLGALL
jgi:hypothetical protein